MTNNYQSLLHDRSGMYLRCEHATTCARASSVHCTTCMHSRKIVVSDDTGGWSTDFQKWCEDQQCVKSQST
jgi:hypothetical protein